MSDTLTALRISFAFINLPCGDIMTKRSTKTRSAITRRDFLGATLIGSGAALLELPCPAHSQGLTPEWNGPGGVGDYARSNGNVASVVNAAHGIRDGAYEATIASARILDEPYDLVIVGAGFAGLIAAYEFHKAKPEARCLVIDNHPIFGGEAKQNQLVVDGVLLTGPQGSNDASVPQPNTSYGHVVGLWEEIGMPRSYDFVPPAGTGARLKYARDNFYPMFWEEDGASLGYYFDKPFADRRAWVVDPWKDGLKRVPLPEATRSDWLKWKDAPVLRQGDEAATDRWLDSMSYGDLITRELKLSKDVFRLADPLVATGDYGVSADAVSAYGAKLLGLPGTTRESGPPGEAFSFPGGNAAILRHLVKALLPETISGSSSFADILFAPVNFTALDRPQHTRIRLNATVVSVKHAGAAETAGEIDVVYSADGGLQRVRGKAALIAAGGWVTRRIVRDLPESYRAAYAQFHHGPMLVANVAVRNWQAMAKLGITAAHWFDGFGFFLNVRQPMRIDGASMPLDPARPAMLTLYIGFPQSGQSVEVQTVAGRAKLFGATYADLELKIRHQLEQMFGSAGFNARRDIAGIILNRWGHAYIAPQPGFYFGSPGRPAPLPVLRERYGRIAFGHSELSGRQSWGRAALESRRALKQLLEVLI